eukprot:m.280867 g.280867  ORF g.280867 m.280867 type:complete len:410 (-) comp54919_c1_seq31:869-2098(-)
MWRLVTAVLAVSTAGAMAVQLRAFQPLPATAAESFAAFTIANTFFLAVANAFNGTDSPTAFNASSAVLVWTAELQQFVLLQNLTGCSDCIGLTFVAVPAPDPQHDQKDAIKPDSLDTNSSVSQYLLVAACAQSHSLVYAWNSSAALFQPFQTLHAEDQQYPSTYRWAAASTTTSTVPGQDAAVVLIATSSFWSNAVNVYAWSAAQQAFVPSQVIPATRPSAVQFIPMPDGLYLAFSTFSGDKCLHLCSLNLTSMQFNTTQRILLNNVNDIEFFVVSNQTILVAATADLPDVGAHVFLWSDPSTAPVSIQNISCSTASWDATPFSASGEQYLAMASLEGGLSALYLWATASLSFGFVQLFPTSQPVICFVTFQLDIGGGSGSNQTLIAAAYLPSDILEGGTASELFVLVP